MPSQRQWGKWAFAAGCPALIMIFLGCSHRGHRTKANNLRNVGCKLYQPKYPGTTAIEVNSTDGIKWDDEVVFVCPGEKLHWQAASGGGVKSIDLHFLNNEWPFKQPFTPQLHGDAQTPTPDLEVAALPPNFRAKAYKYQIHVVTSNGTIDLDPHIIPIGKGGS